MPGWKARSPPSAVRPSTASTPASSASSSQQLLKSPFSLSEARMHLRSRRARKLHRHRSRPHRTRSRCRLSQPDLAEVRQTAAIVARKPSQARPPAITELSLTAKGRAAFAELDAGRADDRRRVARRTGRRGSRRCRRCDGSRSSTLLGPQAEQPRSDFCCAAIAPATWAGWCQSHGALYAQRIWLGHQFRGAGRRDHRAIPQIVRPVARALLDRRDRRRAGRLGLSGQRLATKSPKLRLLLVDPDGARTGRWTRGWSNECIRFARRCGYRKITLWTQSILVAARKIYQDAGFVLVATEPHRSFGQSLIGETWELQL